MRHRHDRPMGVLAVSNLLASPHLISVRRDLASWRSQSNRFFRGGIEAVLALLRCTPLKLLRLVDVVFFHNEWNKQWI